MHTKDMHDDMEMYELSDEVLDSVTGGAIHHSESGQWEVINDKTSQVVKRFDSKQAAMAYAIKFGYSTKIV